MNLSGGLYTYNRFDEYEKALKEASKPDYLDFDKDGNKDEPMTKALKEKGASNPQKMKAKVDKAGKKSKAQGKAMGKASKEEEKKEEENTAGDNGNGGGVSEAYGNLAQRKVEKLNNTSKAKAEAKIMSEAQEQRMAMYSRALGVMGAQYSGPGFGVQAEGLAPGGEGRAEGGKAPGKMKAAMIKNVIKKKMAGGKSMEEAVDEAMYELEDLDEGMAVANPANAPTKIKAPAPKNTMKKPVMKEDLTKEDVVAYLVDEGYASNEVSAEILHTHISDEFLEEIEGRMLEEGLEKFRAAQKERRENRKNPDEEKVTIKSEKPPVYDKSAGPVKKLKARGMRKGEGIGRNK